MWILESNILIFQQWKDELAMSQMELWMGKPWSLQIHSDPDPSPQLSLHKANNIAGKTRAMSICDMFDTNVGIC